MPTMRFSTKAQFRTWCKHQLFKQQGWDIKDHKITTQLQPHLKPCKRVLLFCPLAHEPNLMPLIKWARQRHIQVFVPTLAQDRLRATPYRLPLQRKKYGILEPAPSLLRAKLDLGIIPVLGMDKAHRRIGFGKGYYDSFFAKHPNVPLIFIARKILQSQNLLGDNHDIVSARYFEQRTTKKINTRITNGLCHRNCSPLRPHRLLRLLGN